MSLYAPELIDHARRPRCARSVTDCTHEARCSNPLCGDRVTASVRVERDRLAEVGFDVRGCAVCQAAASMLSERLRGASTREALDLHCALARAIEGEAAELGSLAPLLAVRDHPARRRCATLPGEALERALRPR